MQSNAFELLTREQLAKAVQVSPRTVDNWRARRMIPFIKIGSNIRFRAGAVMEALQAFEHKQHSAPGVIK